MQMAASSAAETGRRYEVIIDPTDQSYLLREITSSDLSEVLEEEIVTQASSGATAGSRISSSTMATTRTARDPSSASDRQAGPTAARSSFSTRANSPTRWSSIG